MWRSLFLVLSRPALALWHWSGWEIEGDFPDEDHLIVVAAPHTSNWDYWHFLMAARQIERRAHVTIKQEWIRRPVVGHIIRWLGGIGVNRERSSSAVQQMAANFQPGARMLLVFTPDGTRSFRPYWRTGFYYTALAVGVPILLAYPDYPRKRVGFGPLLHPTGAIEADFPLIQEFYATHGVALHPERANTVQRRPDEPPPRA